MKLCSGTSSMNDCVVRTMGARIGKDMVRLVISMDLFCSWVEDGLEGQEAEGGELLECLGGGWGVEPGQWLWCGKEGMLQIPSRTW